MDTQAFLQKHDQIMFAVLVVMLTVALLRFGYAGASKRVYVRKPEHRIAFDAPSRNIAFATFRGIPQNPSFRIDELEQLVTTFPTRDGDVFICTYPKCGTTWMQQICHLLVHGGEQGSTTMYATAPWLECLIAAPILHEREANNYSFADLASMPAGRPRFFKSHANFGDLPRGRARVKTIIVSRNPKDTCVSMWHHVREKPEFNLAGGADASTRPEVCPSFADWVELFLSGQCECGSWFHHTLEWYYASLNDPDILFLKYEDLIDDPRAGIARVAKHIGVGDTPAIIEKTLVNSSMDAMKSGKTGIYAGNVRKGGVGNWRKKIDGDSDALFDRVYKQQMAGSGLKFNFGDGVVM